VIAPRIAAVAAVAVLVAQAAGCGGPAGGLVGAACVSDSQCHVGLQCNTSDPGGLCGKSCVLDEECGVGAVCNAEHGCYTACDSDQDCTRGAPWACVTDETNKKFCDVGERAEDGGSDG
jgi:hypothetical protein